MKSTARTLAIVAALASASCTDAMTTNVPEVEQGSAQARDDAQPPSVTEQVGGAPKRTIDRVKGAADALDKKGARDDEAVRRATE